MKIYKIIITKIVWFCNSFIFFPTYGNLQPKYLESSEHPDIRDGDLFNLVFRGACQDR